MRVSVMAGALALLALAGVAGCDAPSAPGPASIVVLIAYVSPPPDTLPPPTPESGMCAHHLAPVNLTIASSWGETRRLPATGDRSYALQSPGVTAGQEHWLTFVDIALCPTGTARVTQGVTVNGVALVRTIDRGGVPALAFRVDGSGRVTP